MSHIKGRRTVDSKKLESRHGPVPLQRRGRFDAWSRTQSETFRWNVASVLVKRARAVMDLNLDPYRFLLAIPDPCWSDGDVDKNYCLAQLKALFQKDEDLLSPIDKTSAALSSFEESEVRCRSVNDAFLSSEFEINNLDAAMILHYSRRKIAQILGDAPKLADLKPSFGPGANVTCKKKTSARFKLSTLPSISKPSLRVLFQMAQGVPRWLDLHKRQVKVVAGELQFVNKNYKTKRAIVMAPTLTSAYQRPLGVVMKQRLKENAGIDLWGKTQGKGQQYQRERARLASLTGDDATVDLKGASDAVAYMLVLDQLPEDWFDLLDSLRDDRVQYRGRTFLLEKFSSMGCGFTFELETLLFYSLAYGIGRHFGIPMHRDTISVYGDDIIAPTALARLILDWFPKFGFEVNREKTFLDGPFRESCGGDYVLGIDVRPFFIRDRMTHHKLVSFYNHLTRKPHQDPDRKIRDLILGTLPDKFKNFGPDGYGDGHLISGADLHTYGVPLKREFGYSGWSFDTYVEIPKRDKTEQLGDQLYPFYSIYLKSAGDPEYEELIRRASAVRGVYKDAFIRQCLLDVGTPLDHFVLRKDSKARTKARKVRVYVLGPS